MRIILPLLKLVQKMMERLLMTQIRMILRWKKVQKLIHLMSENYQ